MDLGYAAPLMSRTALLGPLVLAVVLALAVPTGAPAARGPAPDRLPQALPAAGPHTASAASATLRWLIGARASRTTARLARVHGARPLAVRGAYVVDARHARALAAALRHRGLLRFSEPDVALTRASAYEGDGADQTWTRGAVVAAGLAPPPAFAPIGILDDVVDTGVADVGQAKVLASSPTKVLPTTQGVEVAHGTEVASVAAGRADGAGVIGIAPGAPLLSYGYKSMSCAELSDGIVRLSDAGAKVINLSFSANEDCHTLQLATAAAFGSGAVVVAAAGNQLREHDPVVYPAAYPHVLSVGALDITLQPASFSSTGAALDLAAPGEDVPVAVPPALDLDGTADGLTRGDGTSFAAPIVSGVASWLIAARPKLDAGQYGDLLRTTAKDVGAPGWDSRTGFGLVDLAAALTAPAPAADRNEPNDGIDFVDGSAFSAPDPYIFRGGAARTTTASVDAVEDPLDVYRIQVRPHQVATVALTPRGGNADLAVYAGKAGSLASRPLARSRQAGTKTDRVRVRNRTARAATFYVAVLAPTVARRSLDTTYALKVSRG
jgi:hypothetical protein